MKRLIWLVLALVQFGMVSATEPGAVIVYSERKEHLIQPVFEAWTAESGIPVRYITDSAAALIERLDAEGGRSPADLLITVDAGNLWHATRRGVLQPVRSGVLESAIPAHLRDPDGHWFGLSLRARTIVYSTARVTPSNLSTYGALAGERWRNRLCLRTSKKVYNQSLVAGMIARHGRDKVEAMVAGWVDNLATEVFSSDTLLIRAIAAGQCDVGIVNTYYLARAQREEPDLPVAVFWANQEEGGVHVNVSGAGVTAHAPHREAAVALLEWLAGEAAQELFARLNLEYPARPGVTLDPLVAAWGPFRADPVNVAEYGRLQQAAVMLMDRAGYR